MTELDNNNHFKPRTQQIDPFTRKMVLNTYYNYFKLVFMSIFVLPIRLIGVFICLVSAYMLASIGMFGITDEELASKPLDGWRRHIRRGIFLSGRNLLRCCGFTSVTFKGECAPMSEAPIIIMAPHTSFFDAVGIWWSKRTCPGIVSRVENLDIPFIGKCMRFVQAVNVERQADKSRKSSAKEVMNRVSSKDNWPPIVIFPEGTCTNGQSIISFKLGAFLPGVPVQPVLIHYKNKTNCTTWTAFGPGALTVIWTSMCQFVNYCEIEFLPVYTPNEIEKEHAFIYATNVRNVIAKALGLPMTEYSFEDARLMMSAESLDLPPEVGLIEFQKFRKDFGLDISTVRDHFMSQFAKMSKLCDRNGLVDIHGFAKGLHLPISEPLVVSLFNHYDLGGRGTLNFKEYVSGRCAHTHQFSDPTSIRTTYAFFRMISFKSLSLEDFAKEMYSSFHVSKENCLKIFQLVDVTDTGFISEEAYQQLGKIAPEYFWIICKHLKRGLSKGTDRNSEIDYHKIKPE